MFNHQLLRYQFITIEWISITLPFILLPIGMIQVHCLIFTRQIAVVNILRQIAVVLSSQ